LSSLCARADGGLDVVAERLAHRASAGRPALDPGELGLELRAAGAPWVWPRSWSYSGPALAADEAVSHAKRWLSGFGDGGTRTCGAAIVGEGERQVVTLVAVDALADLELVPTLARPGQWLDVTSRMLVPARDAKVVLLGPRGAPRAVPTSFQDGIVRARFAPNGPGTWLVQVVADVKTGPRPVIEAMVHADQTPPSGYHPTPAPGEAAGAGVADDGEALLRMINSARRIEGLRALRRDAKLDGAAQAQADAMRDARQLGHDVGKGDVGERLTSLGVEARAYGENVARAATPGRGHRAIWASPSHRGNLLEPRYDSVGLGTARGPDGVWICEVFAEMR
jgi:uncharacterized protein YkwD